MSDSKRLESIMRIIDKATVKLEAKNRRIESLIAEIERLEALDRQNNSDMLDQMIEMRLLRERIERLEDIIRRALAVPAAWGDEHYKIVEILNEAALEGEVIMKDFMTVGEAIRVLDRHANDMGDDPLRVRVATNSGYLQILSVYEADGNLVVDVDKDKVLAYEGEKK